MKLVKICKKSKAMIPESIHKPKVPAVLTIKFRKTGFKKISLVVDGSSGFKFERVSWTAFVANQIPQKIK